MPVSQARLKHLLNYDPETGIWTWNNPNPRSARVAGEEAGSVNQMGYRILRVDCLTYRSARLAYFYMTGEWPVGEMDHVNRIRYDDRWSNIKSVDQMQNLRNRGFHTLRGISTSGDGYSVNVCGMYLGVFDRLEPAMATRDFALWYEGAVENII